MSDPDPSWILNEGDRMVRVVEHWTKQIDYISGDGSRLCMTGHFRDCSFWAERNDFSDRDLPLLVFGAIVEHVEALMDTKWGQRQHVWSYRVVPC